MSGILSPAQKILNQLGENIKLARRRRKIRTEILAEQAGVSRATLWQIEKGSSSVSMGAYIMVMYMLGLENDLRHLASDDKIGRRLQDERLLTRDRALRRKL